MPSSCARNEIADALAEAFPTLDDLARFRLANALNHAAERAVFESLDQALALVPLKVRVEEAESLAARLREVVAERVVRGASDNGPIPAGVGADDYATTTEDEQRRMLTGASQNTVAAEPRRPPVGTRWGDLTPNQRKAVPDGTLLRQPSGYTVTKGRPYANFIACAYDAVIESYPADPEARDDE